MNKLILIVTCSLFPLALFAQPAKPIDYSGKYSNQIKTAPLELELKHLQADHYQASLATSAPIQYNPTGSCAGALEGQVDIHPAKASLLKIDNESFLADEPESPSNRRYCQVELKFLSPTKVEITELEGCTSYHGASCDFNGVVKRHP